MESNPQHKDSPPAIRPAKRARLWLFVLFLVGGPLLLWLVISPSVARRINHTEWTQWAHQDLRALAAAVEAYRAAEGAWPPALANLTPDPLPRTSIEPRRRRFARPTPTPTPLPPEVAARTFIPHLPVDPYAPSFDFPRGQTYTYVIFAGLEKSGGPAIQSEIRNPQSEISFIILSPGPDYVINLDLAATPDPAALPAFAYDPTNGLISGGDIFITGPKK